MDTTTQAAAQTQAGIQTFAIDPSHSELQFRVRHLGFSKVSGRFTDFEGTVRMEAGRLETLEAEATARVASVYTGDDKRDAHLRSEDFFHAETHPELTFRTTGVRDVSGNTAKLAGDLTIRGVTRPVVLDVEYLGEAQDPWGGQRVAFEATGKLDRTEFGLRWNAALEAGGFLVANEVELRIEVQAVRQDAA